MVGQTLEAHVHYTPMVGLALISYIDTYRVNVEEEKNIAEGNCRECRSEERSVGKECSSWWSPDH